MEKDLLCTGNDHFGSKIEPSQKTMELGNESHQKQLLEESRHFLAYYCLQECSSSYCLQWQPQMFSTANEIHSD